MRGKRPLRLHLVVLLQAVLMSVAAACRVSDTFKDLKIIDTIWCGYDGTLPGPGETRMPRGFMLAISSTVFSSFLKTMCSQPKSPRYCINSPLSTSFSIAAVTLVTKPCGKSSQPACTALQATARAKFVLLYRGLWYYAFLTVTVVTEVSVQVIAIQSSNLR